MNITEAKKMALELATRHKLFGWKLFFRENRSNAIATCWHRKWTIEFNSAYISVNSSLFCRDTILHEIAHALVGLYHRHDLVWKNKCVEIGAVPVAIACETFSDFKSPYDMMDMENFAWNDSIRVFNLPLDKSKLIYVGKEPPTLIQEGAQDENNRS